MVLKPINNPTDLSIGEKVIHNARVKIFNDITGIEIITKIIPGKKEMIYILHGWDRQRLKLSESHKQVKFSDLARTYKIYEP